MYQVDRTNGSALISVLVSFFYYKSPCVYLWKNYDSNIVIYLQEYLNHILSFIECSNIIRLVEPLKKSKKKDIKRTDMNTNMNTETSTDTDTSTKTNFYADKITMDHINYIVELLRGTDFPLKQNRVGVGTKNYNFKTSTFIDPNQQRNKNRYQYLNDYVNASRDSVYNSQSKNNNNSDIDNLNFPSNILKDLSISIMNLFEIKTSPIIDIFIKSNVLKNSFYYPFLSREDKNIVDLFNEWLKEKNRNYLIVSELEYLIFFIKKDNNTKINIQKRIIVNHDLKNIKQSLSTISNSNSNDSITSNDNNLIDEKSNLEKSCVISPLPIIILESVFKFRAVLCYSVVKCTYYVIIKILSCYYMFDIFTLDKSQLSKISKIKMKSISDTIKSECVMMIYKKK